VYKIELTCGQGWSAPSIGGPLTLAAKLDLAKVENLARSMLEVARENDASLTPDGYRITYYGEFRAPKMPQRFFGAKRRGLAREQQAVIQALAAPISPSRRKFRV
jgi:hypothetical protein